MQELTKRQQEIIAKSLGVIAERGIQNLTIKNIAREIGVTEPALYRHFPSKFALLDAMLDDLEEDTDRLFREVKANAGDDIDHIRAFLYHRLVQFSVTPALARVIFAEEIFQDDPRLAAKMIHLQRRHRAQIMAMIEAGQRAGTIRADIEAQELFLIIFGPIRLLIKQWAHTDRIFDLPERGKRLLDAFHKLLSTRLAGSPKAFPSLTQ